MATKGEQTVHAVVNCMERDIIFGRILPRQRLFEDELIYRFEIKRHVARKVLVELEQLGIVVRTPYKGASVRHYSSQEVAKLYEVREILHEAAARRIRLPADEHWLGDLQAAQNEHAKAVDDQDIDSIYEKNILFHRILFEGTKNPFLSDALSYSNSLTHCIRSHAMRDMAVNQRARDDHEQMVAAIQRNDSGKLVRLCLDHLMAPRRFYEEKFCGI